MAYNKGSAITIPTMASKSCKGVSKRNFYSPLTATYEVVDRTYVITVSLACYFGVRINVDTWFSQMIINGEELSNYHLNGWIAKDEPGKEVATCTITGKFNADGTPDQSTVEIAASGLMMYYSDVSCTTQKSVEFYNTVELEIEDIEPAYTSPDVPTLTGTACGSDFISGHIETTSFGEGGGAYLNAQVSRNNFETIANESNTITILSGDYKIPNLQRNTMYYLRGQAANNGMAATSSPVQVYTLAASEVYKASASTSGGKLYLSVSGMVYNGGAAKEPTTYIDYSTDLINWSVADTTESTEAFSSNVTLSWTAGDDLYVRTRTETDAGVYTSGYLQVTVGDKDSLWGYIDSIDASKTTAVVNIVVNTPATSTVTATIYSRLAGIEEEWVAIGTATVAGGQNQKVSYTLTNLNQNNFEYEISVELSQTISKKKVIFNTDSLSFFTIPYSLDNNTCDSLEFMVDLICQSLDAIKHGNITVFMNDDTKKWCEMDDDDTPTLASIMSRVNRFMHAVGCVLCTVEGFVDIQKDNDSGQVFMGKMGWIDIDDAVSDGSRNPVFSGVVHAAIDDLIHKVWHYFGAYDYFGYDLDDLESQEATTKGQTGIVGNQVYTWSGSAWANPTTVSPEIFGVIHINSGDHAGKAYYWFSDEWNRLDVDTTDMENRIEALEALKTVETLNMEKYIVAISNESLSDTELSALIPTNATKDTIIILKEDS